MLFVINHLQHFFKKGIKRFGKNKKGTLYLPPQAGEILTGLEKVH
jgi:hypothetical protein